MSELDKIVAIAEERTDTHVRVPLQRWADAARLANNIGFRYFSFLSGLDWLPNPALDGEHHYDTERKKTEPPEIVTDPNVRIGGGNTRFQVFARVQNLDTNAAVILVADVDEDLHVPTWTDVYAGANWHERETWEMFGFIFDNHPGLRHIYLPEEFSGFPLRKDFALPARLVRPWPGLVDMEEMPSADESQEA